MYFWQGVMQTQLLRELSQVYNFQSENNKYAYLQIVYFGTVIFV